MDCGDHVVYRLRTRLIRVLLTYRVLQRGVNYRVIQIAICLFCYSRVGLDVFQKVFFTDSGLAQNQFQSTLLNRTVSRNCGVLAVLFINHYNMRSSLSIGSKTKIIG